MKKIIVVSIGVSLLMNFAVLSSANEGTQKKKINLDVNSIIKASKAINQYQELFKDPEKLERFLRVSRALKQKNQK